MEKSQSNDEVYLFKTIQHTCKDGTIATINIYRPILTPEEREKREKQIMTAIGRILLKNGLLDKESV